MRTIYKIALVLIGVILLYQLFRDRDTHTRMFCAYGRVFVEFEEGGNIWGTMMLDQHGRPIPCKEDDVILERSSSVSI